jgi:hypothetical protein
METRDGVILTGIGGIEETKMKQLKILALDLITIFAVALCIGAHIAMATILFGYAIGY